MHLNVITVVTVLGISSAGNMAGDTAGETHHRMRKKETGVTCQSRWQNAYPNVQNSVKAR